VSLHKRPSLSIVKVGRVGALVEQLPRLQTGCNQPEDNNGHKRADARPFAFVFRQSPGIAHANRILDVFNGCHHL
jgi:hypothetical protein